MSTSTEKLSIVAKREIQYRLRIYVATFASQKKACTSLDDVSEAVVISMLNNKETSWDMISDKMWRNVAAQVGSVTELDSIVETENFRIINRYFNWAKKSGSSFAMVGNPGWGKSFTSKWYAAINRKENVYYLECNENWSKKMFLKKLLLQMGVDAYLKSAGEMMEMLISQIRKQHKPLIIMDEVDKLSDGVLKFFITLYNDLNKHCGFVWLSTDAMEKRMLRGIERKSIGFPELFSRIGATFIKLREPKVDEVTEIINMHGISDKAMIAETYNQVKELRGDLRRAERCILKYLEKQSSKKAS